MQDRLDKVKEVQYIQGQDGNYNNDSYMCGMYNGLELAVAIMENRDPEYKVIDAKQNEER